MSGIVASAPDGPPAPRAGAPWSLTGGALPACGVSHRNLAGRLDESARRLDHPELAVASLLAGEGHDVRSLADRGRREPTADLEVCGLQVEVKALLTLAERSSGRPATDRTVHNRLASAVHQAAVVVLSTAGSGCRRADAVAGLHSFAAAGRTGKIRAVRLLGEGFDLSWCAPAERELSQDGGTRTGASGPPPRFREAGSEPASTTPVPGPPRSVPGARAANRAATHSRDRGVQLP